MRLGINMPILDHSGEVLDAAGIEARAAMIEDAGFDGIWNHDTMYPPSARPDALLWLLIAAAATRAIEVGTCIYIIPARRPVETAQRFMSLEALVPGRFTIGVGSGSTATSHEAAGISYEDRFRLLYDHMDTIRRLLDGEAVGAANLSPWPSAKGGPRFVLGAWYSNVSLQRSVRDYDGWMTSAGAGNRAPLGGWKKVLGERIKRYRDLGGTRALVATCRVDLSAPSAPLPDEDNFNLVCGPEEAHDRIGRLAEMGYDDLLVVKSDHTKAPRGLLNEDFTAEELDEIRALIPRDPAKPY